MGPGIGTPTETLALGPYCPRCANTRAVNTKFQNQLKIVAGGPVGRLRPLGWSRAKLWWGSRGLNPPTEASGSLVLDSV